MPAISCYNSLFYWHACDGEGVDKLFPCATRQFDEDPFNTLFSRRSPMLLSQVLGRFNLQMQGQVSEEPLQIYPTKIILDY